MSFSCSKCSKTLSSKNYLKKHEDKCNGLKSTQCELCHKEFSDKTSKFKHKKNKVCERNGTMITINGDQNPVIVGDNNTLLNNSPITIIFNFGEEKDNKLTEKFLDEVIREKDLNGIFKLIKHRYFNKPENNTIRKVNKKDTLMDVMKNGEWIKTPCDNIIEQILNKITEEPNWYVETEVERHERNILEEERHKKINQVEKRDQFIKEITSYLQKVQVLGYFYERQYYLNPEHAPSCYIKEDYTALLEYYQIKLEVGKNKASYKKQIREYLYVETKNFLEKLKNRNE